MWGLTGDGKKQRTEGGRHGERDYWFQRRINQPGKSNERSVSLLTKSDTGKGTSGSCEKKLWFQKRASGEPKWPAISNQGSAVVGVRRQERGNEGL